MSYEREGILRVWYSIIDGWFIDVSSCILLSYHAPSDRLHRRTNEYTMLRRPSRTHSSHYSFDVSLFCGQLLRTLA